MSTIEVSTVFASAVDITNAVEVFHQFYNAGEKEIKYITFSYVPYNAVNDMVACTISGETEVSGKLTGPIPPKYRSYVKWEHMWFNPTVTYAVLTRIIIQYMDNTEEVIEGKDIVFMEDHNSTYYNEIGREEEAERARKDAEYERILAEKEAERARLQAEYERKKAEEEAERARRLAEDEKNKKIESVRKELQNNWSTSGRESFSLDLLEDVKNDEEILLAILTDAKIYYSTGYEIGDFLEKEFSSNENIMKKAVSLWKESVAQQQKCYNTTFAKEHPDFPQKYATKIQKYEPAYVMPEEEKSFIDELVGKIVSFIEKIISSINKK